MRDLIYCAENIYGESYRDIHRDYVMEWYANNHGNKIYSKTKDLFPTINIIVNRPNADVRNIREENDMENATSVALRKAIAKYDSANTKQIKLKLNLKTDKDILDKLEEVEHTQTYIKELIRKDIESKRKNK